MEDLIPDKVNDTDEEMFGEIKDEWNISFKDEKVFWENILIPNMDNISNKYPYCKLKAIQIEEKKKNDLINPYYILCNNKSCKWKQSIQVYSFLNCSKLITASIFYEITCLFLIEMKHGKEIENSIKSKYGKSTNYGIILKILHNIWNYIAEYIKYKNKKKQFDGAPEENKLVAIDESLIAHKK